MRKKIQDLWRHSLIDNAELWRSGLHGFERETFRLNAASGIPSSVRHEELFTPEKQKQQVACFRGSAAEKAHLHTLLPSALTLDFSDQQPELVSPPHDNIAAAEADIALLLRFVAGELQDEILWAFSQPPLFHPQDLAAVRVADFGAAADAQEKEHYRKQLLLRYGRAKQSWTGIHYNFSLDLRLFHNVNPCQTYIHLARNLWRKFWVLELLFGCTPSVSPYYASQIQQHFSRGGSSLAAAPDRAASLHSHFGYGYRSSEQQLQYLDYSDPCAYWHSIQHISQVQSPFFQRLGLENTSLIQDSRELYVPFRLKQLHAHGNESTDKECCLVDYLELRILDIDPFFSHQSFSGIHLPAIYLSHLLLLHSTLLPAPALEREELLQCAAREQYVLSQGMNPLLPEKLTREARDLLEELGELATLLSFPEKYSSAVTSGLRSLQERTYRAQKYIELFANERSQSLLSHSRAWTELLQNYA